MTINYCVTYCRILLFYYDNNDCCFSSTLLSKFFGMPCMCCNTCVCSFSNLCKILYLIDSSSGLQILNKSLINMSMCNFSTVSDNIVLLRTMMSLFIQSFFFCLFVKVVEQGMFVKHCKVEVYLTELKLCEDSNMDNVITRRFSKADTIGKNGYSWFQFFCILWYKLNCLAFKKFSVKYYLFTPDFDKKKMLYFS